MGHGKLGRFSRVLHRSIKIWPGQRKAGPPTSILAGDPGSTFCCKTYAQSIRGLELSDANGAEGAGFVDFVKDTDDGVGLVEVATLALAHMPEHSVIACSEDQRCRGTLGHAQTVREICRIHDWLLH